LNLKIWFGENEVKSFSKNTLIIAISILLLGISLFMACAFGSSTVPLDIVVEVLKNRLFRIESLAISDSDIYIVWNLRFPRAVLAFAVGGGLAVSGAAMQSITKNVMADPYVLGISSGALAAVSVGYMIGGFLTMTNWFIPILAFAGSLGSLVIVFLIGGGLSNCSPAKLVLSGMAVSITLNAVAQFCIYNQENTSGASSIVNWMMGSLGGARWANIVIPVIGCFIGLIFFMFHARSFDLIALGDDTAVILGTNTKNIKILSMIVVAIVCGVSVASCGIIGLVGFMIPHIVRFVIGTDHKREFPLSFMLGGIFLIIADILARTLLAPSELPVGIFTALCGGPYFIWLLHKRRVR